jgi:hypothetical protein
LSTSSDEERVAARAVVQQRGEVAHRRRVGREGAAHELQGLARRERRHAGDARPA